MRAAELLSLIALLSASPGLAGCPSSDETAERAAEIAPAPPGSPAPVATSPTPVATGTIPAVPPPAVAPPATRPPAATLPDAGTLPGIRLDAGAPADAGQADAGTASAADAGTFSSKLAACASKCQGILQACLMPSFSTDGGLPQMKDPAACQAAFESCRTTCTP